MSAEHNQGPLSVRETCVYFSGGAGGFDIRNCPNPEANARRLAACWNACDGLPTALIEKHGVTRSGIAKGVERLVAQRDDLLEVLQAIVDADDLAIAELIQLGVQPSVEGDAMRLTERARAAIAKVKEGGV